MKTEAGIPEPHRMARIAVVEDDPGVRRLLERLLVSRGHEVVSLERAEEVEGVLNQVTVDLLITDMDLPGEDGRSLARRLKGNPATQSLPVILTTAFRIIDDLRREGVADLVVEKPFNTFELLLSIDHLLGTGGGRK